jgi:hypothetical protein
MLLLAIVIEDVEHEHDHEQGLSHFALVATIASARYMSRLLP